MSWCNKKIRDVRESLRLIHRQSQKLLCLNGALNGPSCLVSPQLPNNASKSLRFSHYWAKVVGMPKDQHCQMQC